MSWLNKLLPPKIKRQEGIQRRGTLPEGLWSKCPSCEAVLYATDLEKNLQVCPKCGHHNRLNARKRLNLLLDAEGPVSYTHLDVYKRQACCVRGATDQPPAVSWRRGRDVLSSVCPPLSACGTSEAGARSGRIRPRVSRCPGSVAGCLRRRLRRWRPCFRLDADSAAATRLSGVCLLYTSRCV